MAVWRRRLEGQPERPPFFRSLNSRSIPKTRSEDAWRSLIPRVLWEVDALWIASP